MYYFGNFVSNFPWQHIATQQIAPKVVIFQLVFKPVEELELAGKLLKTFYPFSLDRVWERRTSIAFNWKVFFFVKIELFFILVLCLGLQQQTKVSFTHYFSFFVFPQVQVDGIKKEMLEGPFDGGSVISSVPSRWMLEPGYMHSFAMTNSYFILVEQVIRQ